MKKYVITGLLVAGFATPAIAAEFFCGAQNTTHKCSIVSKKSDGKRLTQLGTEVLQDEVRRRDRPQRYVGV